MSKSNSLETDILKLIFTADASAAGFINVAANSTTSAITSVFVSLHTADPGEAGSQTTNEAAYTSYARVGVARTTAGWTVANGSVSPVASVSFPASGSSGASITHFGVGTLTSAAGYLFYSGTVTPNIAIGASGITPILTSASTITED